MGGKRGERNGWGRGLRGRRTTFVNVAAGGGRWGGGGGGLRSGGRRPPPAAKRGGATETKGNQKKKKEERKLANTRFRWPLLAHTRTHTHAPTKRKQYIFNSFGGETGAIMSPSRKQNGEKLGNPGVPFPNVSTRLNNPVRLGKFHSSVSWLGSVTKLF